MHRILNKKAKQSKTMQTVFGLKKSEIPANGNDLPGFLHQLGQLPKGAWKNRIRWKDILSIFAVTSSRTKREEKLVNEQYGKNYLAIEP